MSMVIVSPMARPPRRGAWGWTAVPNTTVTRKKVPRASTSTPAPGPIWPASRGVPRCVATAASRGNPAESATAARTAPASWATTKARAGARDIRRPARNPKVTAGLKWPPDTAPRAETMTPMARPWARAIPRRPTPPRVAWSTTIAPAPAKMRVKVPMTSASSGFHEISGIGASLPTEVDVRCRCRPEIRLLSPPFLCPGSQTGQHGHQHGHEPGEDGPAHERDEGALGPDRAGHDRERHVHRRRPSRGGRRDPAEGSGDEGRHQECQELPQEVGEERESAQVEVHEAGHHHARQAVPPEARPHDGGARGCKAHTPPRDHGPGQAPRGHCDGDPQDAGAEPAERPPRGLALPDLHPDAEEERSQGHVGERAHGGKATARDETPRPGEDARHHRARHEPAHQGSSTYRRASAAAAMLPITVERAKAAASPPRTGSRPRRAGSAPIRIPMRPTTTATAAGTSARAARTDHGPPRRRRPTRRPATKSARSIHTASSLPGPGGRRQEAAQERALACREVPSRILRSPTQEAQEHESRGRLSPRGPQGGPRGAVRRPPGREETRLPAVDRLRTSRGQDVERAARGAVPAPRPPGPARGGRRQPGTPLHRGLRLGGAGPRRSRRARARGPPRGGTTRPPGRPGLLIMRRTYRTLEESRRLLDVAAGRRPADLYLEGATLLNVYTGELYPANVAVAGGRIAYVGRSRAMVGPHTEVLALPGKILVPGYIDPHTHITGMTTPVEFARAVLPGGTTTLVADAPRPNPRAPGRPGSPARAPPVVPPDPPRLTAPRRLRLLPRAPPAAPRPRDRPRGGGGHALARSLPRGPGPPPEDGARPRRRAAGRGTRAGGILRPHRRARVRGVVLRPRGHQPRGGAPPPPGRGVHHAPALLAPARSPRPRFRRDRRSPAVRPPHAHGRRPRGGDHRPARLHGPRDPPGARQRHPPGLRLPDGHAEPGHVPGARRGDRRDRARAARRHPGPRGPVQSDARGGPGPGGGGRAGRRVRGGLPPRGLGAVLPAPVPAHLGSRPFPLRDARGGGRPVSRHAP